MFEVFGKNILKKGFCIDTSKFQCKEYFETIGKIETYIPKSKQLITLLLTQEEIILKYKGHCKPQIVQYTQDLLPMFDYSKIYECEIQNRNEIRPKTDFVIFNERDNLVFAIYSKEAMILFFEDENGNKAVGRIFNNQLIYEEDVFNTILRHMGRNVKLSVPIFKYCKNKEGTALIKIIEKIASKYQQIKNINICEDPKYNSNLFNENDLYYNCILVW